MSTAPRTLPSWRRPDPSLLGDFARIQFIAADLDGTLVTSTANQVDQYLERFVGQLRHYRYRVVLTVATGRAYAGVESVVARLGLASGLPLILYNGAVILRPSTGETILRRTLSDGEHTALVQVAQNHGLRLMLYFIERDAREPRALERVEGLFDRRPGPAVEPNGLAVEWRSYREFDPARLQASRPCAAMIDLESAAVHGEAVAQQLRDAGVNVTSSSAQFLEIRPRGATKASALEILCHELGYDRIQVLALGDSDNDIEMLRWAGIGVAVRGASSGAMSACDFVSNRDAIQGAVEVVRLIREARFYVGHE